MFWKLAAAVIAAIVAAQLPTVRPYWGWILLIGVIIAVTMGPKRPERIFILPKRT